MEIINAATLWNRWKMESAGTFSQAERSEFANLLMSYIITSVKRLIDKVLSESDCDQFSDEAVESLHSKETVEKFNTTHAFVIDLVNQLVGKSENACIENLFLNPLPKSKSQSLWTNHEVLSHICQLFHDPLIQHYYKRCHKESIGQPIIPDTHVSASSLEEYCKTFDKDHPVVNDFLLGNYLHLFMDEKTLIDLSELFVSKFTNTDSDEAKNKILANYMLKAKIISTNILTLKYQFSKRSISTKVIQVIERRKKYLQSHQLTAPITTGQPITSTNIAIQHTIQGDDTVKVSGKTGAVDIPKLTIQVHGSDTATSLLPKSARSPHCSPHSSPRKGRTSSDMSGISEDSTLKKKPQKLVDLVRKRSSSTQDGSHSPISPCVSPATSPRQESVTMTGALQHEKLVSGLDVFEKKKLHKFTMIDTPGIASQRDLVNMTLQASTKPTATFMLKTIVFTVSLADFDLPSIDDPKTIKLHESLKLFEKVMSLNNLKEFRRLLVFTHVDVFVNRIMFNLTQKERHRLMNEILNCEYAECENMDLVKNLYNWIAKQFHDIENRLSNQHKYALEVFTLDLMNPSDVFELTYSITMRDGKLTCHTHSFIPTFISPLVTGELRENIWRNRIRVKNTLFDISIQTTC